MRYLKIALLAVAVAALLSGCELPTDLPFPIPGF